DGALLLALRVARRLHALLARVFRLGGVLCIGASVFRVPSIAGVVGAGARGICGVQEALRLRVSELTGDRCGRGREVAWRGRVGADATYFRFFRSLRIDGELDHEAAE